MKIVSSRYKVVFVVAGLSSGACVRQHGGSTTAQPTGAVAYVPDLRWSVGSILRVRSDATGQFFLWGAVRAMAAPPSPLPRGSSGTPLPRAQDLRPDADVRFAEPFSTSELTAAVRLEHGWLFVDQSGQMLIGDTYLGPLRLLGSIPPNARASSRANLSRGRLVLRTETEGILTTDGTAPLAPLRGLPAGAVHWVAFANARRGLVGMWDGHVHATHDGGETFRPLDPGAGVLVGEVVAVADDGVFVRTTDGLRRVREDDALEHVDLAPVEASASATDREVLLAQWMAQHPAARLSLPHLASGEQWLLSNAVLRRFDGATGRIVGTAPVPPALAECQLESWGTSMTVRCSGDDGDRLVPLRSDGTAGSDLPIDWDVSSDDGQHAAFGGPCSGADRRAHAVCVRGADGGQHELALPESARQMSLHGGRLLARSLDHDDRDGAGSAVFFVDIERRTVAPVALRLPVGVAAVRVHDVHFTHDGAAVVLARPATRANDGATFVGIGAIEGPIVLGPLPPLARRADFVDARHGFAAGENSGALFETLDGGVHWSAVQVHGPGGADYPMHTQAVAGQATPEMHCAAEGCLVGGALWLPATRVGSAVTLGVHTVPAPDAGPRDASAAADDEWAGTVRGADIVCAEAHAPTHAGDARRDGSAGADAYGAVGGVRWTTQVVTSAANATLRLKWEGGDEFGTFRSRATSASVFGNAGAAEFQVLGGDRGHALLEWCPRGRTACSLWFATNHGGIVQTLAADAWSRLAGSAPVSLLVYSLPLEAAVEFSTELDGVPVAVALLVAQDGHVANQRSALLSTAGPGSLHGLGLRGHGVGLAVRALGHGDAIQFLALAPAGGVDASLPLARDPVLGACATRPTGWSLLAHARAPDVTWGPLRLSGSQGMFRVGSDGHACLDAVTALGAPTSSRDWTVLEVTARPTGLTASEPAGPARVACSLAR